MEKKRVKKPKKQSKHYKGWYRFLRGLLFPLGKFLFPTTALGLQNLPTDGKFILAGNHRSWKDLPVVGFSLTNYFHYVSKEEYLNNAVLRWLFSKIGVYTVNRQSSDLKFVRNVISALEKNEPIAIFPEGTRNRNAEQEMLELKNGTALFAYKTGAAIVPFVIYKYPKTFRRNYIYVAEPIRFTDGPQSGIIDRDKLSEAAVEIKRSLEDAMATIHDIVTNKRVRAVKKADKKAIKAIKAQRKLAKKQKTAEGEQQ